MVGKTKSKSKNRWYRRLFRFCLVAFVLAAVAVLVINLRVKSYVKDRIVTVEDLPDKKFDCILVLGAGLTNKTTPSPMLEDRILKGIELYKNGASPRLLMSGDHGRNNHDEVGVMRDYAIGKGVSGGDIFMDHAGFSTYESIYRAEYIFDVKTVVIVTQAFHLERAVYIAKQLGLDAYGVSADLRDYGSILYNQARDVLARVKDFFMVIFRPEPTYLGDKISLKENGEVTLG